MSKKSCLTIAIFHCGFIYSGGGERIVLEEAKGLFKKGHNVQIFAPTLDTIHCYPEEITALGVKTFLPQMPEFFPGSHAVMMIASSLFAPFFAFRFRHIDIFIGANQPGAWIAFCVAKVLRKPYVVYLNQPNRLLYPRAIDIQVNWQNLHEYYLVDNIIRRLKFFVSWADRISFTKSNAMLVNGAYIGNIIRKVYKQRTIDCPAGARPQRYNLLRVNPHTAYEGAFPIINTGGEKIFIKKPYILMTNRHVPQKKFEYGIQAFKIVLNKYPDLRLVIPGPSTEYTDKLRKEMSNTTNVPPSLKLGRAGKYQISNKIIFTGEISEATLQKLYREALVYLYTAPEEDFGMGIVEAMSWGVPVVAWNHAGPTVTVDHGKTGFLAKPYDVSDFAQKIISAIENQEKRAEMGKNAWKRVKEHFSWEKHVSILEKAIRENL